MLTTSCAQNIQAVGVVVADVATEYSHWTAVESLSEWCAREGVVCRILFRDLLGRLRHSSTPTKRRAAD